MKRRSFLQFLGLAPAAPIAANLVTVEKAVAAISPAAVTPIKEIGGYQNVYYTETFVSCAVVGSTFSKSFSDNT